MDGLTAAFASEVDAQEHARERAESRARQREHGWNDQLKADLVERCRDILCQPYWPERLQEAFEHGERRGEWTAWRAGPLVGLDLWEAGLAKLKRDPLDDGLVFRLMHGSDRTHQERIVEWAEQHLPLEKIATGPAEHLFPAEHREITGALTFIVQEMRDGELYSVRLVAAALIAPVIGIRNQALNAVEAQPRQAWGSSVEAALHRLTLRIRTRTCEPAPSGCSPRAKDDRFSQERHAGVSSGVTMPASSSRVAAANTR